MSIIKTHRDTQDMDWANQHINRIKGRLYTPERTCYEDTRDGRLYSYISGAIAWPGRDTKGFAVIVGVEKTPDIRPRLFLLDEIETQSPQTLLGSCIDLRDRYVDGKDSELMSVWYGDLERFLQMVVESTSRLEREFIVAPPINFEEPNAFEIYFATVDRVLRAGSSAPMLTIGDNPKTRAHIQQLRQASTDSGADHYPAAAALGYVIHTLLIVRPWERMIDEGRPIDEEEQYILRAQQDYAGMIEDAEYYGDDVYDSAPISDSVDNYR